MSTDAIELLSQYIRLDTSNPPGNEYLSADFFSRIFKRKGIRYKTYEAGSGRVSIRAEIKGEGRYKPIILLHHMDVVPADKTKWSFDPFGGEVIDGYICGRGAIDTKSLGIIQLLAFLDIKKKGLTLNRDLVFLATADEEIGGNRGVEYLLHKYPAEFQADIVLNEGSYVMSGILPRRLVATISTGEKGLCFLRLERRGEPGHGSTPHGQNALEKLTIAASRLLGYKAPSILTPIVAEYFRKMAAALDILGDSEADRISDAALLKIVLDGKMRMVPQIDTMHHNTISLNMMKSGVSVNVIPGLAEAFVDTRLLPGEKISKWLRLIRRKLADNEIQIHAVTKSEANASETNTESYRIIEQTLLEHYPYAVTTPYLLPGATDSRFFRKAGTLAYGFCPAIVPANHLKLVHGVDERIEIYGLLKGVEVYTDLIRRLCVQDVTSSPEKKLEV